jgi:hypothetical protein
MSLYIAAPPATVIAAAARLMKRIANGPNAMVTNMHPQCLEMVNVAQNDCASLKTEKRRGRRGAVPWHISEGCTEYDRIFAICTSLVRHEESAFIKGRIGFAV